MKIRDVGISFVIKTNGEKDSCLRDSLTSIKSQGIPIDRYEIIVVGITDIKKDFKYLLAVEDVKAGLLGKMNNMAVNNAAFPIVTIIDDDFRMENGWWDIVGEIRVGNWDLIAFRTQGLGGKKRVDWLADGQNYTGGYGILVRKDVAKKVKWEENIGRGYDFIFCQSIIERGGRLRVYPQSEEDIVTHSVSRKDISRFKQEEVSKSNRKSLVRVLISLLMYNNSDPGKIIEEILDTAESDFHLVVTDNVSEFSCQKKLIELVDKYSGEERIEFRFNKENVGYNPVHTKLASELKNEDFFCILNDDLSFKEKGWDLKCINEFSKNPKLAEVGLLGSESFNTINAKGEGVPGNAREYVEGSFIFIPNKFVKEMIEARGGLFSDEYEFIFGEDSDLSLTLRERGYDLKLLPLKIEHKRFNRKSSKNLHEFNIKNNKILCKKWAWYLKHRKFEKKILLKRERGYGDMLFLTPFIKSLKDSHPAYKIYVKTNCPQALANNPSIAGFHNMNNDEKSFDAVYDFEGAYEKTPLRPIFDSFQEVLDIPIQRKLFVYPTEIPNFEWKSEKKKIFIDNNGSWKMRNWGRWNELIPLLKDYDVKRTSDFGKKSLTEFAYIISQADLFVGIDNVWFHMSQAVGKKSVTIWGGTSPEFRATNFEVATFIRSSLGCQGCYHRARPPNFKPTPCSREEEYQCLKLISPEMVKKVIDEVIDK